MWRDPMRVPSRRRDPRARDVVRRDRRGASSPTTARSSSNVVSSQAELHARYGGVVPEVASRRHLELVAPGRARGARARRARRSTTSSASPSRRARARSARCSSASRPRRRSPGRGGCRSSRSTTCTATSPRSTSSPTRSSRRSSACSRAAGTRCCSTCASAAATSVLGTTLDDAAGEAFDKGARLLGLGYPGGAAIDRLAREGDPDGVRVPGRARAGPRLLLLGAEDGAALRGPRPRRRTSWSARRADLAASYQRAIVRALVERLARGAPSRRGSTRIAVVGGVAANSELRAALPDAALAPLALCTDNAAMIASARAVRRGAPVPSLS